MQVDFESKEVAYQQKLKDLELSTFAAQAEVESAAKEKKVMRFQLEESEAKVREGVAVIASLREQLMASEKKVNLLIEKTGGTGEGAASATDLEMRLANAVAEITSLREQVDQVTERKEHYRVHHTLPVSP